MRLPTAGALPAGAGTQAAKGRQKPLMSKLGWEIAMASESIMAAIVSRRAGQAKRKLWADLWAV